MSKTEKICAFLSAQAVFFKRWFFVAVIFAAFLFLAFRFPELRNSFAESIAKIPLWSVVLLLGIQIVTQILLNIQWNSLAAFAGARVKFGEMFYINSQAEIVHSVPAGYLGSEITRFVKILSLSGCGKSKAAAIIAAQKIFSLTALFLICILCLGFIIGEIPWINAGFQVGIYGLLSVFLLSLLAIFFAPERLKAHIDKKSEPKNPVFIKLFNFLRVLLNQLISIRQKPKTCACFFLLAVLIWLLFPLKMYILSIQINHEVSALSVAAAAFVSYAVGVLPIFPGGLGGFELTMTGLLSIIGFSAGDALALTVIFRFVTFWFVLLASFAFIGFYKGIGGVRER